MLKTYFVGKRDLAAGSIYYTKSSVYYTEKYINKILWKVISKGKNDGRKLHQSFFTVILNLFPSR